MRCEDETIHYRNRSSRRDAVRGEAVVFAISSSNSKTLRRPECEDEPDWMGPLRGQYRALEFKVQIGAGHKPCVRKVLGP